MNESSLILIALPIGNPADLSPRTSQVLPDAQGLICEEYKTGARLLKSAGVTLPLHILNEHSTDDQILDLFKRLFVDAAGTYALISDAGTPCFADPGAELVALCYANGIPVQAIPGASALTTALMLAGKRLDRFHYYGFLSANHEQRRRDLQQIKRQQDCDYFILDAPYRLKPLLRDMGEILGGERQVRLFYKLTHPDQQVIITTLAVLRHKAETLPKGEFVLLLER
ncbi:MAG: hypothetical protein FJ042_06875 [Candidatus Cloacimonetes bacterium]|nr:hypothetical protein [Candidatus Cloacimonadota bacterium]